MERYVEKIDRYTVSEGRRRTQTDYYFLQVLSTEPATDRLELLVTTVFFPTELTVHDEQTPM